MNQSPGGSSKVQTYPDAYFAVKAGAAGPPLALQTHPRVPGLKGVQALTYMGSYPVTKLTPSAVGHGKRPLDLDSPPRNNSIAACYVCAVHTPARLL